MAREGNPAIAAARHFHRPILDGAASLFPGYFALVMATGVVSIACQLLGMRTLALALVAVNWVAYPILWALTFLRALRFRELLLRDISDCPASSLMGPNRLN